MVLNDCASLPRVKPTRGEVARIATLGDMDDRHKRLLEAGDKDGLLELATEYECLDNHGGCPRMAQHIRLEANLIKPNL